MFWSTRYRKWAPAIICLASTVLVAVLYLAAALPDVPLFRFLNESEYKLMDWRVRQGRPEPQYPKLVYLAIDDATITLSAAAPEEIEASPALKLMKDGFPFPRSIYPMVMEKLFNAGAKLIIFDLLFFTEKAEDPLLKQALDKYSNKVVVGWNYVLSSGDRGKGINTLQFPSSSIIPQNVDPAEPLDRRLGSVNYPIDSDGIIRRAQFGFRLSGSPNVYLSLPAKAAEQLGHPELVPQDEEAHHFRWAGPPASQMHSDLGFVSYSLWEIFVPKIWQSNYKNGEFFRDSIVLIGAKGNFSKDELNTPYGIMPGPEVHLNVINAVLRGAFIYEMPFQATLFLIVAAGTIACWVLYRIKSSLWVFVVILLLNGIYIGLGFFLYDYANLYHPMFFPVLALDVSWLLGFTNEFVGEQIERRRTRATLERYVSKNMVRELLDNPETFYNKLGGVRLPVTVLFSDVRDFTTMTERADPSLMVGQLNEYLREMTRIVFANQGTLDKFVGDAVMAVWGNIQTVGSAQDADNAVRTALQMLESLRQLNESWQARGLGTWAIGVGINQGEAIAGSIGSAEKMDPTVIGDAVNTASRLEGLTKKYHVPLLIGATVALQVKDKYYLQSVDRAAPKGKTHALDLYTVLGEKSQPLPKAWLDYLEVYEEGVRLFRQRNFTEALEMFESILPHRPDDFLAQMYIERCREFLANPPEESWSGVVVFKEK